MIAGNSNFVKRVVFPLDLLVAAQLGTALAQLAMSAVAFLIVRAFLTPAMGFAAWSVPLLLVPYVMLVLGLSGSSPRWASTSETSTRWCRWPSRG